MFTFMRFALCAALVSLCGLAHAKVSTQITTVTYRIWVCAHKGYVERASELYHLDTTNGFKYMQVLGLQKECALESVDFDMNVLNECPINQYACRGFKVYLNGKVMYGVVFMSR